MKKNPKERFCFRANAWLTACAFLAAASTASGTILIGDPADYESRRQQIEGGAPSVSAGAGGAGELRVFAEAQDGFLLDEGRPILQFDLSALSAAPASATFSAQLLSLAANLPFAVEVWGSAATWSAPFDVNDPGASGQFASAGYERAQGSGEVLVDDGDEPGRFSADVTEYLSARYDEYAAGGDSWIFLRLQPESNWGVDDGIDADFAFASSDHVTESFHPTIDTVAIPEPAGAAWLLSALAGVFALWRVHRRGRR